jgi:hypothetical protein
MLRQNLFQRLRKGRVCHDKSDSAFQLTAYDSGTTIADMFELKNFLVQLLVHWKLTLFQKSTIKLHFRNTKNLLVFRFSSQRRDNERDLTWPNYCLNHLYFLHQRTSPTSSSSSDGKEGY